MDFDSHTRHKWAISCCQSRKWKPTTRRRESSASRHRLGAGWGASRAFSTLNDNLRDPLRHVSLSARNNGGRKARDVTRRNRSFMAEMSIK